MSVVTAVATVEFFPAVLVGVHGAPEFAFWTTGCGDVAARIAAGAISDTHPLATIAARIEASTAASASTAFVLVADPDADDVAGVARLPDGQFGLFAGFASRARADEADVEREVAEAIRLTGAVWIVVSRACGPKLVKVQGR